MAKRTSKQRVLDKAEGAASGAVAGATVGAAISGGNPVGVGLGAAIGAAGGLYYAHNGFVFPENVIIIPARQEYLLTGTPDFKVIGLLGESVQPTGMMDDIYQAAVVESATVTTTTDKTKKRSTKYTRFNKRYKFRAKRKNESSGAFLKARNQAVSKAWRTR